MGEIFAEKAATSNTKTVTVRVLGLFSAALLVMCIANLAADSLHKTMTLPHVIATALALFTFGFGHLHTEFFGNNWQPQSLAELICDGICLATGCAAAVFWCV